MNTPHHSPSPFQGEGRGEGPHPRNLSLVPRARTLRRNQTDAEKLLWRNLRSRQFQGFKFRRQYPVGFYVADFICSSAMLILEIDGGQHALNEKRDAKRDEWLKAQGYRTLRFWNNDVFENLDGVLATIASTLSNPHPNPLPEREREYTDFDRRDV